MPLLWLSLAFLSGLCLGKYLPWQASGWITLAAASLLIWLLLTILYRRSPGSLLARAGIPNSRLRLPPVALLTFLFFGAARISLSAPDIINNHIAAWNDRGNVTIQAVVISAPDRRDTSTLLRVSAESAASTNQENITQPAHGMVQVLLAAGATWQYGDRLLLTGKLVTPPENEDFSYRDYLARQNIHTYLSYPKVRLIEHDVGNPILAAIYRFRDWSYSEIYHLFPAPEAPLLAGILLGIESGITPDLTRAFQDTGAAHVIAISGFNIAILINLFSKLFSKVFSRWWASLAAILAVTAYTLMVGASPSVVRAAIMGSLALIATQIGRRATAYNSLALAAGVMALANPHIPWDAGFQLSFAATLGLVLYGDRLQNWFNELLARRLSTAAARAISKPVGEYFLLTLAAQVMTLPIILYHFGRLSISSLLVNPLILPVQPLLMTFSGLAVLSGLLADPLAHIIAWLAWLLPAYTIRVVEWFAAMPGSVFVIGEMGLGAVLLMYVLILSPLMGDRFPSIKKLTYPGILLGCLTLLTAIAWRGVFTRPDGYLHLTALDLDNHQVIFIRGPGGQNILINGGPGQNLLADALGRRLSPFDRRLDTVLVNSARAADIASLANILERYPADMVLWGCQPQTRTAETLVENLKSSSTDSHMLATGEALAITQDIHLDILTTTDNGSALLLRWANFQALVPSGVPPGQIKKENLANLSIILLDNRDLKETSAEQWLSLAPQAILYTPGEGDLEINGLNWLNTHPQGWVSVTTDGKLMWLERK